jgi:hypothetical protein
MRSGDEVFTRAALEQMAAQAVGKPVRDRLSGIQIGVVTAARLDDAGLEVTARLDQGGTAIIRTAVEWPGREG